MKTEKFVNFLRAAADKPLRFLNRDGEHVHPGYHLTEIKAVSYDTVDCGGQTNRWNETIFQLWVPEKADDEFMRAGKFVGIFDRVKSAVDIDPNADVRFEYGDDNFFPSVYSVESIRVAEDALQVLLIPPSTTCKARDRRGAQACC